MMQQHAPPGGGGVGPAPPRFTPPTPVHVPIQAVRSIVPQLATAINDIDALRAQIAAGNANGSMPSWDTLLQRYALLLTRVQSLTKYVSEPPKSVLGGGPGGAEGAASGASASGAAGTSSSAATAAAAAAPPALAHYLVHPLRTLPPDVDPLAPDVLFQAINTMPLPVAEDAEAAAASSAGTAADGRGGGTAAGSGGTLGAAALSAMDDGALARLTDSLRSRLGREGARARAMAAEIERRADEYDWTYRPDADDGGDEDEGDEEEEGKRPGASVAPSAAASAAPTDKDDDNASDLFGGDDDEDEDMAEVTDTGVPNAPPPLPLPAPNPREGWAVADYLAFVDSGRVPPPPAQAAPPAQS